jgi:glutamate racemase
LVATRNLSGFLAHRYEHPVKFVAVTDHGHAPYGDKAPEELDQLVNNGLKALQAMEVDVIAMACNTACTTFAEGRKGLEGITTPVLDLIRHTAQGIAQEGADKPALLATPATAGSDAYPQAVAQATGGRMTTVPIIGAPRWAPLINELKHLSPRAADQAETAQAVRSQVEQLPPDTDAAYLACTHYPAIQPHIQQALADAGRGHIAVVDPMGYQADAVRDFLDEHGSKIDRSGRRTDPTPLVVTSGNLREAEHSARALMAPENPAVLQMPFQAPFDTRLVREQLFEPRRPSAGPSRPETSSSQARRPGLEGGAKAR